MTPVVDDGTSFWTMSDLVDFKDTMEVVEQHLYKLVYEKDDGSNG